MQRPGDRGLSEALRARLATLAGDTVVRVVILLARPRRRERGYEHPARELAVWLVERHGRVLRGPDILGTLLVEAPAAAIPALAEHEAVDALVEDQEVGPGGPRR